MPVFWRIERGLVIISVVGVYVPQEELSAAVDGALEDPEFRSGMALLFDARSALSTLTPDFVQSAGTWLAGLRARGLSRRYAVVSAAARVRFAEQAAAIAAREGMEPRVFIDYDQAVSWLAEAPAHDG